MLRSLLALALLSVSLSAGIIPRPLSETPGEGTLLLRQNAPAILPAAEAPVLTRLLAEAGLMVSAATDPAKAAIRFAQGENIASPEGYRLIITPQGIGITARTATGRFYGIQSLAQLIASAPRTDAGISLPCSDISDAPRFAWRGYMLDESRHFTGEAGVKRILDAMAHYKMNRFHWHLTDSPAWRIEIKKYPKLTSIGGRGSETNRKPDAPAQFYTQEQIKNIVAYAKARAITIVPEIDMPGHADAAVLAYPEHDGGGFLQKNSKDKWPRFTFNPAKKETLAFLDDVLTEVAALFPDAGVIHYGGDEVHFGWHKWTQLSEVKERMEKENLKDLAAVESWFNRRMAKTINQLGFKTGGWDEIASRGLPADKTIIWWWRHDKPAVLRETLAKGYPVILTPRRPCYLDFLQNKSHKDGRNWGGINELAACYRFPADLKLSAEDEKKVLGIQGSLWAETAISQKRRDFLTWPRLVALAEAGWTTEANKDFASFEERLKPELLWLKKHGITPYDPFTNSPEVSDKSPTGGYLDNPE